MKKFLTVIFAYIPAAFVVASLLIVTSLKWVKVEYTPLMLKRSLAHAGGGEYANRHKWVPLEEISENMIKAAIVAEDARFFQHQGFDFEELKKMRSEHELEGGEIRGCSTISQQTAKNCFTWCSKTWLRKGMEAYWTVLIEKIWGKRRILEVYLNVAEMGPGIYGVEAAAQHYFNIHASQLTLSDATSLVCCLPNPLLRDPSYANQHLAAKRDLIAKQVSENKQIKLQANLLRP